jgi:hypothetical protein
MTEQLFHEIEKYKEKRNMNRVLENRWLGMFLNLLDYKSINGNCNVPAKFGEYKPLGYWVRRQRLIYSEGRLDPLRQNLLKLAGFNFRLLEFHDWDIMFRKLKQIKKQLGHVHITENHSDTQLYNWLKYQRTLYWIGKLDTQKADSLLQLGVEMDNKTFNRWESKFEQLVEFKNKYGHLHVSRTFTNDKQLINFVKVIRRSQNSIFADRRNELDKLGFIWNPGKELTTILNRKRADEAWIKRYNELKAYKKQFGTCRVLSKSKTHPTLGTWVSTQRSRLNRLSPDKIELLNEIGFLDKNKPLLHVKS